MLSLNDCKKIINAKENGITDGLIRVSVGIEHIDDIIADFAASI